MTAPHDPWFRIYRRVPDPALRLVCLPHAGGTASFFRGWPRRLPPEVEMLAVRYPGREDRLADPFPDSLVDLGRQIGRAVAGLGPASVAFLGHSMGASVAHEAAMHLEREHGRVLAGLFISARPAPHHLRPNDLHRRGPAALVADVCRLDSRAGAVLSDPDLLELALPAIEADYRLVETYPRQPPVPVRTPIVGYAGEHDPEVTVADVRAWAEVTVDRFAYRVFPGDHFYLVPHEAELVADVAERLRPAVVSVDHPGLDYDPGSDPRRRRIHG